MSTLLRLLIGGLLLVTSGCAQGVSQPEQSGTGSGPPAVAAPSAPSLDPGSMPAAFDGLWASADGQFVATMNEGARVGSVAGCVSQRVDGQEQCGLLLVLLGHQRSTYSFRVDAWGQEFSCMDWKHRQADVRLLGSDQLQLAIQSPSGDPTIIVLEKGAPVLAAADRSGCSSE